MGWFDNDAKETPQSATAPTPAATPSRVTPSRVATPAADKGGSTIGERVQITGTIVADDELVIYGKVEGNIRARGALRIAEGAEVKAVVRGTKVLLEGRLEGDLHAGELAVLGATATLAGNIKAPSLEVKEGAFVKGSVEMPRPEAPAEKAEPAQAKPTAGKPAESEAPGRPAAAKAAKPGVEPASTSDTAPKASGGGKEAAPAPGPAPASRG